MMNPFDMEGPAFLVFYFCLCVAVSWMLAKIYTVIESGPLPQIDKLDTYQMATLRGGTREAILLAVFTLLDRGLLKEKDGTLKKTSSSDVTQITRHMIESKVLEKCRQPVTLDALLVDAELGKTAKAQEDKLIAKGLFATGKVIQARFTAWLPALAVLLGTSGYKLKLAAERGKHNTGFLIFASIVVFFITAGMTFRRRTALGNETIEHLKHLFGRLQVVAANMKPGSLTNETSQLVAVYGIGVLSPAHFPFLESVFRKTLRTSDSGGCGSSCGSSCGGGCGGGCGGCGGD